MKRMGFRESLGLLIVITVAAWGIPLFEVLYYGSASLLAVGTALLFTVLLAVWPFLTGKRLQDGQLVRALQCVECKSYVWPTEQAIGFCLRCGSTKQAVRASA